MAVELLSRVSSARPVILAEGLFMSCRLDSGKFVPEEGIEQPDLLSVLTREFLDRGSDFVDDFSLRCKLEDHKTNDQEFELEPFPPINTNKVKESNIPPESPMVKDRKELNMDGIPLVRISATGKEPKIVERCHFKQTEVKKMLKKIVLWTMEDPDGEDFVNTETFSKLNDALMLLDILRENNMPTVVSFLSRQDEPITITFSKIDLGLDCLLFCLFQA